MAPTAPPRSPMPPPGCRPTGKKVTVGEAPQTPSGLDGAPPNPPPMLAARAEAFILPALGSIPIRRLTTVRIRVDWLNDLANQPPRVRTRAGKPQQYRDTALDPTPAASGRPRPTGS